MTISKEFTIEKAITVITINAVETEKYYDGKCIVLPTVTSNYGEIFTVGSGSFVNFGVYKLVYSVVENQNYSYNNKSQNKIKESRSHIDTNINNNES